MSSDETRRIAEELTSRLKAGASPNELAALCSADLDWNIPGDIGALPWIGQKTGRKAFADFIRDTRNLLEPLALKIVEIFASEDRAVILGELASKVKHTGRIVETAFAIVLTVSAGKIIGFMMLEDSFAVSQAARR
jgi:ketosteroid isomerase-like protein